MFKVAALPYHCGSSFRGCGSNQWGFETLRGVYCSSVYKNALWWVRESALLCWWNFTSQIRNKADYENIGFWSCIAGGQRCPFPFAERYVCPLYLDNWILIAYRTWGYAEPLGRFAKRYLLFLSEREEMLKHYIEAKVWSEKNLAKCVAVAQGDEAYLW